MKSQFGDRDTVGSTYIDAQKNDASGLTLGDINSQMVNSLVDDLNTTLQSNPYEDRPFYVNVVEERDLQMQNAFKRRLFTTLYRPFPEDNTLVFYIEPKEGEVYYCWDLPHHSELRNILSNNQGFPYDYVKKISQYWDGDLVNFGFTKVRFDHGQIEGYDQKILDTYRSNYLVYCRNLGMDQKAIDVEKALGFFWIPNKKFQFERITSKYSKLIV